MCGDNKVIKKIFFFKYLKDILNAPISVRITIRHFYHFNF